MEYTGILPHPIKTEPMQMPLKLLLYFSAFAMVIFTKVTLAQLVAEETISISGTVESVARDLLVVKDDSGKAYSIRVQAADQESVQLAGGQFLRSPAEISVTGSYSVDELQPGQNIRFEAKLNKLGRSSSEIDAISVVNGDDQPNGINIVQEAGQPGAHSNCEVIAQFNRATNGRLVVKIPANNGFTRKSSLSIALSKDAEVRFSSNEIARAGAGATVTKLVAIRLNTGDLVAKTVEIQVTRRTTAAASIDDALLAKYRHLSDTPQQPRLIRSRHYAFMTDISERQAQIILDKLETMTVLLSKYFGRAPSGTVEGFIVRDLSRWPEGLLTEPTGIAKIEAQAGICFNSSLGDRRRAVLYSCDDPGVIQHECTHGFCHLAFGSTGPTWLAEGLAEMGQYWKVGEQAVNANPRVIAYLQGSEPKRKMLEIAVPGRTDPGTWRDYAWRWALCHLLANNPNYADRFKPLAIALMKNQEGATFQTVYGPTARQIAFEYQLFLDTLDNGYRADLCAWQWNKKTVPLSGKRRTQINISAARGWQATGVLLEKETSYDLAAVGDWKIAKDGEQYDAEGDQAGRGRLVAVIFNDFQLSEPFPVGKLKSFVASSDGQLFLRCQDDWNKLSDNSGELTVHIRRTPSNP